MENRWIDRRSALRLGLCAGAGLFPAALAAEAWAANAKAKNSEDVSANEDLMREHGVLIRLLLVYSESARRLKADAGAQVKALKPAAEIIQKFVEGYHEVLEESYVFPVLEKSSELAWLVKVLKVQHDAGRKVTGRILELAKDGLGGDKSAEAVKLTESFKRMYSPHMAWEDTVLFPAFRAALPGKKYADIGDKFESMEHDIFGKDGFENTVKTIADLEKELGINDLSQFTPKM